MTDSSPEQLPLITEDDLSATTESSSSTLRYPQLLLETSFASLLTHSYPSEPTLSTTMEAPQQEPAHLSESWASISDAELSLEEDLQSDHTDLGSLIDIHSTGDVQSIRDDDTSSEAEPDDQDGERQDQQASVVLNPVQTPMNASEVEPNVLEGRKLTLDEPSLTEPAVASKTIRHLSQDELRKSKLPVGDTIVAKIHMPIVRDFVEDARQPTLRMLLFCQEAASEHQDDILHKVADAQLASGAGFQQRSPSSPSKYHVVPDTFGPGSQPRAATIIPVECQLDSTHYTTARFESPFSRTILLGRSDSPQGTVSKWTQNQANPQGAYVISGSQLHDADLAIVVIGDLSEASNRDFARASLAFARRHNVPAIAVRVQHNWVSDPALAGLIAEGLHLTVQDASKSDDAIVRTLPIDIDMFWNLDATQLSRHIRHLRERRPSGPRIHPRSIKSSQKEHVDVEKNLEHGYTMKELVEKSTGLNVNLGRWVRVLMLALCGIMVLQGLSAIKMRYNSRPKQIDGMVPSEAIIASGESRSQSSLSTPVQVATVSKDVAVATTLPSSLPAYGSLQPRKNLEVDVVGDSIVVIKTAREYQNVESLEVLVTREGKALQTEVRVLFPSVWSVQVEPEQAYGHLCVRVWAIWPTMDETVAVYLGPQPSSVWRFKDIFDYTKAKIVEKLASLQDSLDRLQPLERPQNIVKNAQARVAWMMQQNDTAVQSLVWYDRASAVQQTVQRHRKVFAGSVNMKASKVWDRLGELKHLKVSTRKRLPAQLEHIIQRGRLGFDVDLKDRFQEIWELSRKGYQSDTLAMAQERALHIVGDLRSRLVKR